MRLPDRRRLRLVTAAVGLALGTFLIALIAGLLLARMELSRGLAEIQQARSAIASPGALRTGPARATLQGHLKSAQSDFSWARTALAPFSPLLAHAGWLPRYGGELAAAAPAADAAYYASASALHLEVGLGPVLHAIGGTGKHRNLLHRLGPLLARRHGEFSAARDDALAAKRALAAVPNTGDPSIERDRAKLQHYLPGLLGGATWLNLAPDLLGVAHPGTYLFAWEDPMELRATGGFIGASDLLTVRNGTISHRFAGRVPLGREITTAFVPLPEAAYTPETYWLFCDANWSPDYPLTARLERWFYGEDTGRWAQGVIDFVDTGISDILQATGPLYLPAYGRWVNARNVTALAQQYINGGYKGPTQTGPSDAIRKQFFHHVMAALQRRIETLPAAKWPALGAAFVRLVQHRDILLYDRRPRVEAAIEQMGADGRMLRPSGDYLYTVDDNRSYNKLNPYVHERISHVTTILPDLWAQETLTIRYHVDPSPANLRGYGPGLGTLSLKPGHGPSLGGIGTKHDYQDFLRIFVPAGSVLESTSGMDRWAPESAYGRTQFAGRIFVREGRSDTVTIRYRVPPTAVDAGEGSYRLTVQHQPGSHIDALGLSVRGAARRTLVMSQPQGDVHVQAPIPASLHRASVRLGPIHEADPYIPYGSLHDRKHPL